MIRTRIRPLAVATAAAALTFAAVPAHAGNSIKSKVTIQKISKSAASGKVASEKAKCERRRTVVLILVDDYPGAERVGKTKTNRVGEWKLTAQLDDSFGGYFAKVKKTELPSGKICKGDESPVRTV